MDLLHRLLVASSFVLFVAAVSVSCDRPEELPVSETHPKYVPSERKRDAEQQTKPPREPADTDEQEPLPPPAQDFAAPEGATGEHSPGAE